MRYRGVNYDTGVRYTPEYLSLAVWEADLLVELIDLYQEEQIDGAFIYGLSEPSNPFS